MKQYKNLNHLLFTTKDNYKCLSLNVGWKVKIRVLGEIWRYTDRFIHCQSFKEGEIDRKKGEKLNKRMLIEEKKKKENWDTKDMQSNSKDQSS